MSRNCQMLLVRSSYSFFMCSGGTISSLSEQMNRVGRDVSYGMTAMFVQGLRTRKRRGLGGGNGGGGGVLRAELLYIFYYSTIYYFY